jgi:hypothetical protein
MSGIDDAKQIRQKGSKAMIIFLTVHEDTDILQPPGGQGDVVNRADGNRLATRY